MCKEEASASPNALLVEAGDDVAVVLEAVRPGETVRYRDGAHTAALPAAERIPAYHKVALRPIARGAVVRKYGERIGVATADIPAGAHVHTHNLRSADREEPV